MLEALERWIEKADEHVDLDVTLGKRLAPDMYPLTSQICFACFLVQEAILRLSEEDVPQEVLELRQRGWNVDDQPVELSDLRSMISRTRTHLNSLPEAHLERAGNGPIVFSLPDGMTFEMQCNEFVRDWTIPQFYFHICMAYAILRGNSVPLGKVDYVAHMLRHVRDRDA